MSVSTCDLYRAAHSDSADKMTFPLSGCNLIMMLGFGSV